MQLLVTGATGKVGQAFLERFLAEPRFFGAKVVALCHNRLIGAKVRRAAAVSCMAGQSTLRQSACLYQEASDFKGCALDIRNTALSPPCW